MATGSKQSSGARPKAIVSLPSAPRTRSRLVRREPEPPRPASRRLPLPSSVNRGRILWPYVISIGLYHLLALSALVPWLFSWSGVVLAVAGLYVFGTLGINLCYHRLLTHRGFNCPPWLEHALALLGICCLQDTPARWVAVHRLHHQHSDEEPDPHSPLVTFLWGHIGWLMVENRQVNSVLTYDRYARDVLKDPFYFAFERNLLWVWVNLVQWLAFFLPGLAIGWSQGTSADGVRFGLSLLVWGVFVRTVAVWHITWSVNSATHIWGYRNYETGENSRNNWLVALISNGEGWHNNHHADQRSAAHGHRWWEFDVTYLTICLLEKLGLASDVVRPNQKLTET
ncbi:MAG: acyl-CoA desaturase [Planctomycetia bacterium 21-64-5]|nr:MAG: acyl-CoA desaturase [Planctomycetia bacterium 21-64-5]